MPTAVNLRSFAGQWIAQKDDEVIAAADSLEELERLLTEKYHFSEDKLPPIMLVPPDRPGALLL